MLLECLDRGRGCRDCDSALDCTDADPDAIIETNLPLQPQTVLATEQIATGTSGETAAEPGITISNIPTPVEHPEGN